MTTMIQLTVFQLPATQTALGSQEDLNFSLTGYLTSNFLRGYAPSRLRPEVY